MVHANSFVNTKRLPVARKPLAKTLKNKNKSVETQTNGGADGT